MTKASSDFYVIANIMCQAAENLWQQRIDIQNRLPGYSLCSRVGRGRATYFKCHPKKKELLFNFGAVMVEQKSKPDLAGNWLTCSEILRRGYFNGTPSFLNLIAHTVLHEFCHLIHYSECVHNKTRRSGPHNAHFYRLLNELHQSEHSVWIKEFISQQIQIKGICLDKLSKTDTVKSVKDFYPGQKVKFSYKGENLTGQIIKRNRRTLSITVEKKKHIRYRISPGHLSLCPEVDYV